MNSGGVIDAALEKFQKEQNDSLPAAVTVGLPAASITEDFKIYNDYAISKNKRLPKRAYEELPESERADRCVGAAGVHEPVPAEPSGSRTNERDRGNGCRNELRGLF